MKSLLKVVGFVPVVVLTLIAVGCLDSRSILDPEFEGFQSAMIECTVKSTTGVPLEGAIVSGVKVIKDKVNLEIDEETDGEGKYQISDVLPGETFTVTVTRL